MRPYVHANSWAKLGRNQWCIAHVSRKMGRHIARSVGTDILANRERRPDDGSNGRIAETLASLRGRWERFFWRRCRAGLPWFWPARPPGQHAMVEARRMVRWHFGRDHHPVRRKLAQVLVTMAWPLAVLLNLWLVRQWFGPREAMLKRAPGALWAAIRHNILPSEYYEYRAVATGSQNEHRQLSVRQRSRAPVQGAQPAVTR